MKRQKRKATRPMVFRLDDDALSDAVMHYLDKVERTTGKRPTVQWLVSWVLGDFLGVRK